MRTVTARRSTLLLHDDGRVNYPMSKFLTDKFNNPHTQELAAQALRVLYRFLVAQKIEPAVRALEGRALTYKECNALGDLCFRPLAEVELMSSSKVSLVASPHSARPAREMKDAVQPNTAKKRLAYIASYLEFFREVFVDTHVRSSSLRAQLQEAYGQTSEWLTEQIRGTKQRHAANVQSLPSDRFFEVIRAIFVEPEILFRTSSGKASSTLYRDRAMALLACECLRPGAIGNLGRADFISHAGYLRLVDRRHQRKGRPTPGTPVLKLGDSTSVNSASEGLIKLYPFTIDAINDYIEKEREPTLAKHLANPSMGFLFVNQSGKPLKHRSTITSMFHRLGERLRSLGTLDVGNDPHFKDNDHYDFYAYVLRHSAASLFLEVRGMSDVVYDEMKQRFGWTRKSEMPLLYAARAMSDRANVDLGTFYQSMVDEMKRTRN